MMRQNHARSEDPFRNQGQPQTRCGRRFPKGEDSVRLAASIARTFQKRVATALQTSRDFVIPDQQHQARETTHFELITWLVIKAP